MKTNSREIIKDLTKAGFEIVSINGSHHKLKKMGRIVIVPHPKKDLPKGTARNIYKQAGLL